MEKTIRLRECELRKMIAESIKRVLREGNDVSVVNNLQQAYELLRVIPKTGFIPFSSPSPSSTEAEVKKAIMEATRLIDRAISLSYQLGYGR